MKTGLKVILGIACLLTFVGNSFSQGLLDRNVLTGDIPDVVEFNYKSESRVWWSRVAQCQLRYNFEKIQENGLYRISPKETTSLEQKIIQALEISIQNKANIVIFPELILAFEDATRKKLLEALTQKAKQYEMIIICGSFYNSGRQNSSVIITPDGELNGDKIRPSRIETNPLNGYGMKTGEKVAYRKQNMGTLL